MFIEAPKEVSTCRSKSPKGELIERTYDYVIASQCLKGKNNKMEEVEDVETRPHKAVSFVVEKDKEVQEWEEEEMPKGVKFCGQRVEKRKNKMKKVERLQVLKQNWGRSQIEDRDEDEVASWDEHDKLKKPWEEVKKVEEKLIRNEVGGGLSQQEALPKVPELVASQRTSKGKEVEGKEGVRKVFGWSINEMDEKVNSILL